MADPVVSANGFSLIRRSFFPKPPEKQSKSNGNIIIPIGNTIIPDGNIIIPDRNIIIPSGITTIPAGIVIIPTEIR